MERKDEKKVPPTSNKKCIIYNLIKACITTLLLFLMLVSIAGAETNTIDESIILEGNLQYYPYMDSYPMRISTTDLNGPEFYGKLDYSNKFFLEIHGSFDPRLNQLNFHIKDGRQIILPNGLRLPVDFLANENEDGIFIGKWYYGDGSQGGIFSLKSQYESTEEPELTPTEEPELTPTEEPELTPTGEPEHTPTEAPQQSSASVDLYGEKTEVFKGEDIQLKLSAVNLIKNPTTMHVQVIIIPPSGMSVSSSDFVDSGAGQFTTVYDLEPGKGKDIEIRIAANQVGNFNVKGRVVYYFGEDKKHAIDHPLNLPIKVFDNSTIPTPTPTPRSGIPGIGEASLIFILILVFLLIKKMRSTGCQ